MATLISGSLTRKCWESKLVHVQYKGTEDKACARHEFYDNLNTILNPNDDYSIPDKSPLRSKITKATAYSVDLDIVGYRFTEKISNHHFVEMENALGQKFMLEKVTGYILLQTNCDGLRYKDKKLRKNLETLQTGEN